MSLPSPNFKDKKPEESSNDFISFSAPSTPYGKSHTSPNFDTNNFSQSQKYKQNSFQNHRNNYRGGNYKQNWNNRQGGNNRFQNNRQRHSSGNNSSNQSPNTSNDVVWSVDAKGIDNRRSGGRNNPGNDTRSGRKGFFHPSMLENPWQRLEDRMDRSKWRTEEGDDE